MKKRWFRAEDGTYYRNCNLIHAEMEKIRRSTFAVFRWRQYWRLGAEWDAVWVGDYTRKATLGRRDIEVRPRPFREAYPQHPILWTLDGSDRVA